LKALAKSLIRSVGLEVRRLPQPVALHREQGLGFFQTSRGPVYLPLNAPNDSIAAHMRRGELFEPEVIELARRIIRPGTTVLDLGSNFGQMTMEFSRAVGPQGRVYAFEAQGRVFEILKKNIEANDLRNIEAVFAAVLDESGKVFRFPEPDWSRFATYGSFNLPLDSKQGQEVTSIRIDDLIFERPISFMKVDVQGCDLFAMRGARETILRHRMPILFEFEQRFQEIYKTSFQEYVDFVNSINYQFAETVLDINFLIVPKQAD